MSSVASSTAATTLIHDDEPWDGEEVWDPLHINLTGVDPTGLTETDIDDLTDSRGDTDLSDSSYDPDVDSYEGSSDESSSADQAEAAEFDPYEESTGARSQACGVAQGVFVALVIVAVAMVSA